MAAGDAALSETHGTQEMPVEGVVETENHDGPERSRDTVGAGEFRRPQAAQVPDLGETSSTTALEGVERICDRCRRYGVECRWPKEKNKVICGTCSDRRQKCEIDGKGVVELERAMSSGDSISAEFRRVEKAWLAIGKVRAEVTSELKDMSEEVGKLVAVEVPEEDAQEEERWIVAITDSRLEEGHPLCPLHYRVQWGKYLGTEAEYSWVPLIELKHAKKHIERFHRANRTKPGYPNYTL